MHKECLNIAVWEGMGISNLQATKYFDEVRGYFARQTRPGVSVEIEVRSGRRGRSLYIALFDGNNVDARPLELMVNESGTGRRWENQVGSGVVFDVVNYALMAFAEKDAKRRAANNNFSTEEAIDFLVKRMQEVALFLR